MDHYDVEDSLSESSDSEHTEEDLYDKMTVLEAERKRRARLLKKLEQQAKMPLRPEISECLKLRPFFQQSLSQALRPPELNTANSVS